MVVVPDDLVPYILSGISTALVLPPSSGPSRVYEKWLWAEGASIFSRYGEDKKYGGAPQCGMCVIHNFSEWRTPTKK